MILFQLFPIYYSLHYIITHYTCLYEFNHFCKIFIKYRLEILIVSYYHDNFNNNDE